MVHYRCAIAIDIPHSLVVQDRLEMRRERFRDREGRSVVDGRDTVEADLRR